MPLAVFCAPYALGRENIAHLKNERAALLLRLEEIEKSLATHPIRGPYRNAEERAS